MGNIPLFCAICFYCPTYFSAELEQVAEFAEEVIVGLLADQEVRTFGEVMVPVFDIFQGRVKDLDLCQLLLYSYLDVLLYFSQQKDIAKVNESHIHVSVKLQQMYACFPGFACGEILLNQ